jgi:hypothetical protein
MSGIFPGAQLREQPGDHLDVVVDHIGASLRSPAPGRPGYPEVGNEDFDATAGDFAAQGSCAGGECRGSSVREVVPGHGG